MVINFVFVVGTLVFGLGPLTQPVARSVTAPAVRVVATVDNFSPQPQAPKAKKKRPAPAPRPTPTKSRPSVDDGDESPRRPATVPAPRRRTPAAEEVQQEDGADSAEGEEEEEEDQPKAKRKPARRRASDEEEEEEDEDASLAAFAVVMPRLVSLGAGGGLISRSFAFNTPLQQDSKFPRPGFTLALESFPLLHGGSGWLRMLGAGVDLAMEFGAFGVQQGTSGTALTAPVTQRRYGLDVRYAFIPGERVVIVPALGIGNNTFALKTNMPTAPSLCTTTTTQPCVGSVEATYVAANLHVRVAATETLSVTLSAGYVLGLAVGRGMGRIGQERTPKMSGFQVELGGNLMLTDWLAVRLAVPFISHAFTFSGGTGTYTAATEQYVGGTVSAILLLQ